MKSSDAIKQENVISYFANKPVSIFRTYNITLEQFNSWNFNSTYLGSFIYLVWSSERTESNDLSNASIGDSYQQLFSVFPKNILLIKLNYWFSL